MNAKPPVDWQLMTESDPQARAIPLAPAMMRLAQAMSDSPLLLEHMEQVAECALELTLSDHADITLFDPLLRRHIPPRSHRVFMHEGDDDAAAWIRDARAPLVVPDLNYSTGETDLTLYNRDIASYMGLPIFRNGRVEGAIMVFSRNPRGFDDGEVEILKALASFAGIALNQHWLRLESEEASRILLRLALTDPETGVATQQQFEQLLQREWRRAVNEGLPLAVLHVHVDVDGEDATPQDTRIALAHTARLMHAALYRSNDMIARVGDNRLALLLPETDSTGGLAIARRLRREVRHAQDCNTRPAVNLSIGIGSFESLRMRHGPQFSAHDLDRQAAAALELALSSDPDGRLQAMALA